MAALDGDAEGEGGLAHRGAGTEDVQGVGLQAGQQLVEVEEAGGRAGDGVALVVERLEPVEVVVQQVVDRRHGVGDPALGDLEHERLGLVDRLGDVVGQVVAHLGDLAGHTDQAPQQRVLLDDPGVAAGVGDGRRGGLQGDEGGRATDGVEQAGPAQLLGDGDRVGRLTGRRQRGDGLEDVAVGRLVEVLGVEHLGGDGDGVLGQQHRPEERLLGLEVVGWDPPGPRWAGRSRVVVGEAHGPITLACPAWGSVGEQPRFLRAGQPCGRSVDNVRRPVERPTSVRTLVRHGQRRYARGVTARPPSTVDKQRRGSDRITVRRRHGA